MKRRAAVDTEAAAAAPAPLARTDDTAGHSAMAQRRAGPRSQDEAEERYIAARDAWVTAMHAANSGRPADMAALALAQEAYEAAVNERDRWLNGNHVAIPIESERPAGGLDAVVGQELAWRRIHTAPEEPKGILGRLKRRITRR
ncbi:MAG TPA: hypothetical protein VJ975_12220 [Candidatus Limnocylindria bacterium]|nr:hypothetical protein [Candidatus Limnocylindria bacterium]